MSRGPQIDDDSGPGRRTASEKALDRYLLRRDRSGLSEALARRDGTWVERDPVPSSEECQYSSRRTGGKRR